MSRKPLLLLILVLALVFCLSSVAAASTDANAAAQNLYDLHLFQGVGNNADGSPNFDLNRPMTRHEGITMLVRLLGKEQAALSGSWSHPFTDVVGWAQPYVGYAYANGLTTGISAAEFGGNATVSAAQYLTFILRALGYSSETDFVWSSPWTLSDSLGITAGQFPAQTSFLRADAALASHNALSAQIMGSGQTLLQSLIASGAVTDPNVPGAAVGTNATTYETIERYDVKLLQDGGDLYDLWNDKFRLNYIRVKGQADYYISNRDFYTLFYLALGYYDISASDNPYVAGKISTDDYEDDEWQSSPGSFSIATRGDITIKTEKTYTGPSSNEYWDTIIYQGNSISVPHGSYGNRDQIFIFDNITCINERGNELYVNIRELFAALGIDKTLSIPSMDGDSYSCTFI